MDSASYSSIDRLMHRVAFGHPGIQTMLADIEATAFGRLWRDQAIDRPIFITSLPRAGTTLLLEVLARLPSVATHTYRDMPFVRAPILWDRISRPFQAGKAPAERAHGDGIMINVDSPEAFEETLWLAHFAEHYEGRSIEPWTDNEDRQFAETLADHMRRILVLRGANSATTMRYVSKNNANIARIGLLRQSFPDAFIVVPLREPLAQAQSMMRQHLRFSGVHGKDRFAKRYMDDIGHYEFGLSHRPILFDGMKDVMKAFAPEQLEYWIGYWSCAYRNLADQQGITFVDNAGFCADGKENFERLCRELDLSPDGEATKAAARQIKPQKTAKDEKAKIEGLAGARDLYRDLLKSSLFAGQKQSRAVS